MAAERFVSPGRHSVSKRTAPDIRFSDAVPDRRNPPNQGDINNDGNVDMVLLNVGKPPSLLLNHNESPNHRVLFKLVGAKSNEASIGARVTVKAGPLVQIDEVP